MKKFSLNLLKVSLLFLLSTIMFFMASHVEAATIDEGTQELTTGVKKQVVSLTHDQGVFDYYVKDANGNIIEDANTKRGKCEYVKVELSGTSSLYWGSEGTHLTKNVSVTITQPGTYTIEIVKAKHVTGTWMAWKGDTLKYTLEVSDPLMVSFENENVNLNVGEAKEITINATGYSRLETESEDENVASAGWDANSKYRIKAEGVGNTTIKVIAIGINGEDEISATCHVTVVDAEGEPKEEPVTTTEESKKEESVKPQDANGAEFSVGDYVKYTDNTKEGGWNLRKTARGKKLGEIKTGTMLEVTEVSTTDICIKVKVLDGEMEGQEGWLTISAKENFEILKDYTPGEVDDKDDKDDSASLLPGLEEFDFGELNGILKVILNLIMKLLENLPTIIEKASPLIETGFTTVVNLASKFMQ